MAGGTFVFDNMIWVSTGLTKTFTRSVATVNPDGNPVDAGDPRFDREMLLASVEPLAPYGGFSAQGSIVLDSGYDHDGEQELLVVGIAGNIRVFTDETTSYDLPVFQAPLAVDSAPHGGISLSAFSLEDPVTAYAPQAVCVCHGFIGLWCSVLTRYQPTDPPPEPASWNFSGSAMVYSVDQGQNWDLLFDDLADPIQPNVARGNHWSLQKYCAPHLEGGTVHEAWLVAADYRIEGYDETGTAAGGRFFVVRLQREYITEENTWSWGDGDAIAAVFDMDDINDPPLTNSRHAHGGGIVPFGEDGVRFVGSLGDGNDRNRFITATLDDSTGHYTDPADWDTADSYHGRSKLDPAPDPPGRDDGVASCQPVGFLQAAAYDPNGTPGLIIGTDGSAEGIGVMRCPDEGKPTIEHSLTIDSGFASPVDSGGSPERWGFIFGLRTLAPERGTPAVAFCEDAFPNGIVNVGGRYWYQPGADDEDSLGLWANVLTTRYESNGWAVPFQGQIIVGGFNSTPVPFLSARGMPTLVRRRPLLLSPGGKNMLRAAFDYLPDDGDHTLVALDQQNDPPQWVDDDMDSTPLDPQPPSMCDRVFKIKTAQSASNLIGTLYPATQNPGTSYNQTGWTTGGASALRQLRFLVLDNSPSDLADLPRPSTAILSMALTDGTTLGGGSRARVNNQSRWVPHTLSYYRAMASGPRLVLRCGEDTSASNESYFYLACDTAKEGETCLGYPQPPEQNGPDESLAITGFSLDGSFTFLIAGIVPEDDWNHITPRQSKYYPLFTLWSDEDNWIEFGAYATGETIGTPPDDLHYERGSFRLRYKANGNTPVEIDWPEQNPPTEQADIYWARNSQLLVGVSLDTGTGPPQLTLVASLGGDAPRSPLPNGIVALEEAFGNGYNFNTLFFRGAEGGVVTMRWFGGQATDSAQSLEDMVEVFADLSFLTP